MPIATNAGRLALDRVSAGGRRGVGRRPHRRGTDATAGRDGLGTAGFPSGAGGLRPQPVPPPPPVSPPAPVPPPPHRFVPGRAEAHAELARRGGGPGGTWPFPPGGDDVGGAAWDGGRLRPRRIFAPRWATRTSSTTSRSRSRTHLRPPRCRCSCPPSKSRCSSPRSKTRCSSPRSKSRCSSPPPRGPVPRVKDSRNFGAQFPNGVGLRPQVRQRRLRCDRRRTLQPCSPTVGRQGPGPVRAGCGAAVPRPPLGSPSTGSPPTGSPPTSPPPTSPPPTSSPPTGSPPTSPLPTSFAPDEFALVEAALGSALTGRSGAEPPTEEPPTEEPPTEETEAVAAPGGGEQAGSPSPTGRPTNWRGRAWPAMSVTAMRSTKARRPDPPLPPRPSEPPTTFEPEPAVVPWSRDGDEPEPDAALAPTADDGEPHSGPGFLRRRPLRASLHPKVLAVATAGVLRGASSAPSSCTPSLFPASRPSTSGEPVGRRCFLVATRPPWPHRAAPP